MKALKFFKPLLALALMVLATGCFEEENALERRTEPFTRIQFQVPDSNLVPPPVGTQLQLVQPSWDLTVGRYAHASTDARLQVNLSAPADIVEVFSFNTTTLAQELEASATSVSGSTTLTLTSRHVGIGFNAGNLAPLTATTGTPRSVTLRVVARRNDGATTERIFTFQAFRR